MTDENRNAVANLISKLKQERDELKLQMHLGKEDLEDEWEKLQGKLADLNQRFEPVKNAAAESAGEVWESLKLVADEIKSGFNRIRKSL